MKPTSISNRRLTLLRKLNKKKYREQEQLFIIEGARGVAQVLGNNLLAVEALFFDESQKYWEEQIWQQHMAGINTALIGEDYFAEVSDTDNPQGILAVCKMPAEVELEMMAGAQGIIIATDRIQDPGNLGTIIRTASWFGVAGMLLGKGTVDAFHPKVVRSTAGATGTIPYKNAMLHEDLELLEAEGWEVILLDGGNSSIDLKSIKVCPKMILAVGNEANGIDPELTLANRIKARISSPSQKENVESLNAAIATSIALYTLSK